MQNSFIDIANEISKRIRDGVYSDTLPSINQMSAQFLVCPATIKRVIAQLRDWELVSGEQGRCVRVNPKAAGNPYFRKNVVIYADPSTTANIFYLKILYALSHALTERHICLHLFISKFQFQECGFEPDCIVVIGSRTPEKLDQYCTENKIIKLNFPENGYQGITTDNRKAGYNAIRYLAEKCGHRHIGMLATQLQYDYGCFYLRYAGAMEYVAQHPEIIFTMVELDENINNTSVQLPGITSLMQNDPEITAIYASCDLYAMGVYSYAKDHGLRIPEDLSVLSFGNQTFTELMNPPLSTFSEREEDFSSELTKLVMNILDDPAKPVQNTYISPKLLLRGSVAKCKTQVGS